MLHALDGVKKLGGTKLLHDIGLLVIAWSARERLSTRHASAEMSLGLVSLRSFVVVFFGLKFRTVLSDEIYSGVSLRRNSLRA